jgi:uncharacterized protein
MIKIRGHHLSCVPRFYHGGYDKTFADNMKKVVMQIRKNPDTKIKLLIGKPDSLCDECPNLDKNKCVQSPHVGKWVVAQDKKMLKLLKLKENSIHTAKEIYNLSIEKNNPKTIKKVCKGCIFLDNCIKVGINKSFQKELNK